MCQFDEPVLFCVVPRFIWDSIKEKHNWEKGFLLSRHNAEDNIVMPEAVLGHQKSQLRRVHLSCFISPWLTHTCILSVNHTFLLFFVFNTPKYLTQEVSPIMVGLRQDKQACQVPAERDSPFCNRAGVLNPTPGLLFILPVWAASGIGRKEHRENNIIVWEPAQR